MNMNRRNLLIASLTVSAALNAGTASATDDRMWREQVARPVDSVIVLESQTVAPTKKLGNDSLPWREQVNVASKNRVFVLEFAPRHSADSSDWRLWREQITSGPAEIEQKMASDSRQAGEVSNQ